MAHTATASDKLQGYLRTKDQQDLDDADTESDLGCQFFLTLPSTGAGTGASQTDPFFLPGIAKAATIRTMVIVTQDKNFLSAPSDVDQINNMIGPLQNMIDFVKATVNARIRCKFRAMTSANRRERTLPFRTTDIGTKNAAGNCSFSVRGERGISTIRELQKLAMRRSKLGRPVSTENCLTWEFPASRHSYGSGNNS